MYISTFYVLKCFAYVLLFDFCDFQILVNELVTGKVRFPPAPLDSKVYALIFLFYNINIKTRTTTNIVF